MHTCTRIADVYKICTTRVISCRVNSYKIIFEFVAFFQSNFLFDVELYDAAPNTDDDVLILTFYVFTTTTTLIIAETTSNNKSRQFHIRANKKLYTSLLYPNGSL